MQRRRMRWLGVVPGIISEARRAAYSGEPPPPTSCPNTAGEGLVLTPGFNGRVQG